MMTFATAAVLTLMARSVAPLALAIAIRPVTLACNVVGFTTHTIKGLVSDFLAA